MRYLVTGAAGFIGFHLSWQLLKLGKTVIGIDNLNSYYDIKLKEDRNVILNNYSNYTFYQVDISNQNNLEAVFRQARPDIVIHLAAQAGVRYSIENPHAYMESNLLGFLNILECCRHSSITHLLYASSSSVYGSNAKIPFSEKDQTDCPVSFYGATKKSNELMAYAYSYLYKIPCTGLRFFTVYGPWGRPDMAYFSFVKDILRAQTIRVFNYGNAQRDFTYIDDIVEGIIRVSNLRFGDGQGEGTLSRVYNIGNSHPVNLNEFIQEIERALGVAAIKEYLPMQPGDVETTYADVSALIRDTGYQPNTPLNVGIDNFVNWYCSYYNR